MTATAPAKQDVQQIVREWLDDCTDSEKLRIAAFFHQQIQREIDGPPPQPKPLPLSTRRR